MRTLYYYCVRDTNREKKDDRSPACTLIAAVSPALYLPPHHPPENALLCACYNVRARAYRAIASTDILDTRIDTPKAKGFPPIYAESSGSFDEQSFMTVSRLSC